MKIAFFSQLLLNNNKTGIGWLAYNVVNYMQFLDTQNEYLMDFFIIGNKRFKRYKNIINYYRLKGFKINICRWFSFDIYKIIWPFLPLPYELFFKRNADITLFFNYYVPPGVKGKKVVFIHDMTYKAYPETVNKKTLYMLKFNVKKACKRADKIITISEFSKNEIIKYLDIDENKIVVMPVGVNTEIFKVTKDTNKINDVKLKYGIKGKYFLYLGTLEPRKNIDRMIEAYAMLGKENKNIPQFVIAGRKGWMYESIFNKVKELGIENDVIFTGYVEEKEAPLLMEGAEAFLFVSLYEGFGMPILEAMSCGVPIITSNAASMPEVIGDCGLLVNPLSTEEIKKALEKILYKQIDIDDMTKRALQRSENFTWEKSAEKLLNLFEII